MIKPNQIVFLLDHYNNDYESMWKDISMQIRILTNDNYVCKVYNDDGTDIIVVEYLEGDSEISDGAFVACTWEEIETLNYIEDKTEESET